jgi:hypothetical protein
MFALVTMLMLGAWAEIARPGWWLVREPDRAGRGGAEPATAGPGVSSPGRPGAAPPTGPNAGAAPPAGRTAGARPWVGVNSGAGDAPEAAADIGAATAGAAGQEPRGHDGHDVTGPLHGRSAAYLIVWNAASRVEVRVADLPGLLYRVGTPADSGLAPLVTGSAGRVRVRLRPTGADGPDKVTILLNQAVRWDIRLPAGAGEQHLDLSRGRIARLELGAAGLIDLHLPQPAGTVPVTLTDGAGSVEIAVPGTTPVRIRLRGGAGAVTTPWASSNGTPRGAVLTPPGWAESNDRYAVDARADVGALTLQ